MPAAPIGLLLHPLGLLLHGFFSGTSVQWSLNAGNKLTGANKHPGASLGASGHGWKKLCPKDAFWPLFALLWPILLLSAIFNRNWANSGKSVRSKNRTLELNFYNDTGTEQGSMGHQSTQEEVLFKTSPKKLRCWAVYRTPVQCKFSRPLCGQKA